MYFNRTLSFMQNVFSAANLKKYFRFIWGRRQRQESGWRAKERRLTKPTPCSSLSCRTKVMPAHVFCSLLFSQRLGIDRENTCSYNTGSHFSPKFQYPSFNYSHVFIINLNQKYCLVDVGSSTWISAARHPSVNHLMIQNKTRSQWQRPRIYSQTLILHLGLQVAMLYIIKHKYINQLKTWKEVIHTQIN